MFSPRKLAFSLLAIGVLASPIIGRAQTPDDVAVRLTSFAPYTAPDRPLFVTLELTNSGAEALDEVSIRLTIRDRVRSRSALRVALDRQPQGEILAVTTEELTDPLDPGETATVTIQRDLGSLANAFLPGRGGSGVYPLAIRVQAGAQTIAERSGAFVFLAQAPETQLNVVWVLPIHRPTALDATGAYDKALLGRELLTGGTIRSMVEIIERNITAALTLAPTGAFLDQLHDISNGFDARLEGGERVVVPATDPLALAAAELLTRLRAAAAAPAFELATAPYARADLVQLVAADMALDAGQQILAGRESVRTHLGRETTAGLFANAGYRADARSAQTFGALGASTLILDPGALRERPEGRFGNPDRPEEVRATGRSFDALLVDGPARDRLQTRTEDPVVTAMGVFAEAAVTYFEVPGLAAARTIVLATDSMPSPAIARPLADALAQSPWVRLRTATSVATDPALAPTGEPLRMLTSDLASADRDRLQLARGARRAVDILRPVIEAPDLIAALDREILVSESIDYASSRRQTVGAAFARSARATADSTLGAIRVPPRRVTLTSRGGRVPVTVINDTGYTIHVRVRLDSAKVAFPDGASRRMTVEGRPDRQTLSTVTFDLEARAAGSFPIEVKIESPDGEFRIGTGQLLVRSTAVSAVAFAATAGGVLFLLGAWGRRFVKRPKAKATG
ncbi:MAG: DUF6049 family protein [Actinomycetota bacterium]